MDTNEVKFDSISSLDEYYGFEHLNPLVSVGHYDGAHRPGITAYTYGIYAVFIKVRFFKRRTGRTPKEYRTISLN